MFEEFNRKKYDNDRRMLDGCLNRFVVSDSLDEVIKLYGAATAYLSHLFLNSLCRFLVKGEFKDEQ